MTAQLGLETPPTLQTSERILVVDDDPGVRDTIVDILRVSGHQCVPVSSVAEAMDRLASEPADLVITDMHMPGQSGMDLIEMVQKMDDTIPVILITGFPSVHSAVNALKRGAIEFITKPFDLESITQVVAKALRERRLRQEVRRLQAESGKAQVIEKLNRKLNARVEELTRLYAISEAMTHFMDTESFLGQIVKLASQVTGAQRVSLMMLDKGRRNLKIRASLGVAPETVAGTKIRVGQGISGRVAQEGRLIRATRHIHDDFASGLDTLGLGLYNSQSWLSAPLKVGGQVFGVLNLTDKPDRSDFSQEEEQIIQVLVEKAGIKLENQALYEGIYANLVDTLNSLVTTLEAKDPYTREHSHRVTDYAVRIAQRMGLPEEEVEMIEFAGLLHDIGKIGVRDEILIKPGLLSAAEYGAIKEHVLIGDRIAGPLGLTPAERAIIRNHHERFDGKGYPDGFAGEEIPRLARIVTVADALDAMTSTRPYRKALSVEEAAREIEKLRGVQFDPAASDAALAALRDGSLIIRVGSPNL